MPLVFAFSSKLFSILSIALFLFEFPLASYDCLRNLRLPQNEERINCIEEALSGLNQSFLPINAFLLIFSYFLFIEATAYLNLKFRPRKAQQKLFYIKNEAYFQAQPLTCLIWRARIAVVISQIHGENEKGRKLDKL